MNLCKDRIPHKPSWGQRNSGNKFLLRHRSVVWVQSHFFISYAFFGKCFLFSETQLSYQWDNLRSYCKCIQNNFSGCLEGVREHKEIPGTVPMVSAGAQLVIVTFVIIPR